MLENFLIVLYVEQQWRNLKFFMEDHLKEFESEGHQWYRKGDPWAKLPGRWRIGEFVRIYRKIQKKNFKEF